MIYPMYLGETIRDVGFGIHSTIAQFTLPLHDLDADKSDSAPRALLHHIYNPKRACLSQQEIPHIH
jgi:hypothetical protein